MNKILLRCKVCCIVVITIVGCSDPGKHIYKTATAVQPENLIISVLEDPETYPPEILFSGCTLADFYSTRHYNLIWTKNGIITPPGDSLLHLLHKADYYGLIPEDYHLSDIDWLALEIKNGRERVESMVYFDLLMTDAWLAMGHHVRHGRLHREDFTPVSIPHETDSLVVAMLQEAIRKNSLRQGIELLEPDYPAYQVLKGALKNKLDSMALAIADSALAAIEKQVRELVINLEQWRWEPKIHTGRRIVVNIPSYKLEVKDVNDSLVFESNVVVGAPETPTPTLDANIGNFMLFPYWNVPRQIATTELLPKIKRDTTYLKTHRYRVIGLDGDEVNVDSLDWNVYHVNNFPFMLQQTEGAHNALGVIKFMFNNDESIYLHDTNARRFYKKSNRALSHGCVRVERAVDLAKFLVSTENRYCSVRDLETLLAAGEQKQLRVNPIDLHIRYYTCSATPDGSVAFHDDVYNRNVKLLDAIYCR